MEIFQEGKSKAEFKLSCDETTFVGGFREGSRGTPPPLYFSIQFFETNRLSSSGIFQSAQGCSCVVGMERCSALAKFFRTLFLNFLDPRLTFANMYMCRSDIEPKSIIQCTEERIKKVEKRLSVLSRRTENVENNNLLEEAKFLELVNVIMSNVQISNREQ